MVLVAVVGFPRVGGFLRAVVVMVAHLEDVVLGAAVVHKSAEVTMKYVGLLPCTALVVNTMEIRNRGRRRKKRYDSTF